MRKSRCHTVICMLVAVCLVATGVVCVVKHTVNSKPIRNDIAFAAAALMMPEFGGTQDTTGFAVEPKVYEENTVAFQTATPDLAVIEKTPVDLHEDEVHYPVIETLYSESGVSCDNFYIKDTSSVSVDFEKILELPLGFEFANDKSVQVLIYHTHTTESYLEYDTGYYHESFYPRSEDSEKNMVSVGKAIAKSLESQGIGVVHATEVHDSPEYTGAYYRSWDTIEKYMEMYPDIKVVLDIHRDSIASSTDNGKIKPTFEVNSRKAAQIMIMAGCDPDGSYEFPQWEYNLRFALKLQQYAENMYPGMTRPLYFGDFAYNMPITTGSLLIEVGTDVNSLDEAKFTGELLGNVLSKVLQSEG